MLEFVPKLVGLSQLAGLIDSHCKSLFIKRIDGSFDFSPQVGVHDRVGKPTSSEARFLLFSFFTKAELVEETLFITQLGGFVKKLLSHYVG